MDQPSKPIVLRNLFGPDSNFDALDWKPFREGVEIFRIYGDPLEGPAAALLRYQPGARLPYHEHAGWEHILILSRSQCDASGCNDAGTLVVNRPGSGHSVYNERGSIILAIWGQAVRFTNPPPAEAG